MGGKPLDIDQLIKLCRSLMALVLLMMALVFSMTAPLMMDPSTLVKLFSSKEVVPAGVPASSRPDLWKAPDVSAIPADSSGDEIHYGRELIARTAQYLGPQGSVMKISNGMNCQNCHLDAGTRPFGNNYSAVSSTYPKFRARSGTHETIEKRVNDCLERSLNGTALAEDSREMKAIVAYIKWVGKGIPKGVSPGGAGLVEVPFLDQPADPVKGKSIYAEKCALCHGKNGEGILDPGRNGWKYPPLWGEASYNDGAGLYRLSRFAGYTKANMPMGATYDKPQLTDEEVWHLAAYVNSLSRPPKDIMHDWPDVSLKPVDHPFGPFVDGFSDRQHKYGPYKPIQERRKTLAKNRQL